jgi:ABC-type lipoprotein release transport system permease subunit
VAVGVPLAAAASWVIRSELHGVEPADPLVIAGAVAVIALSAALASVAPAVRARRIDPVTALRHE